MKRDDKKNIYTIITVTVLIAIILIIMALIASAFVFGMIGEPDEHQHVDIHYKKIDNSSILIVNDGGGDVDQLDPNNPFTILIIDGSHLSDTTGTYDSKDISNSTAIEASGLTLAIEPAGGLSAKKGAQVTITGKNLSFATLNIRPEVLVIGRFKDSSQKVLLEAPL